MQVSKILSKNFNISIFQAHFPFLCVYFCTIAWDFYSSSVEYFHPVKQILNPLKQTITHY
jgi:hypothetical protein